MGPFTNIFGAVLGPLVSSGMSNQNTYNTNLPPSVNAQGKTGWFNNLLSATAGFFVNGINNTVQGQQVQTQNPYSSMGQMSFLLPIVILVLLFKK